MEIVGWCLLGAFAAGLVVVAVRDILHPPPKDWGDFDL